MDCELANEKSSTESKESTSTRRILLLIKGLGRGGAEQLLVSAAPYLDTARFHYEFAYLLTWKNALVGELEAAGFTVHCLNGGSGMAWMGRLRRLVHSRNIDLIHAHSPYAAIGARVALKRSSRKIVYTEHGVWRHYHPATYWGNLLTFPRNDHVFAVSDFVHQSIRYPRALRFLSEPPTETLYHGLDMTALGTSKFDDGVRDELGIPKNAFVIGTVANFRPQKRHDLLLEAAKLVTQVQPDVRFVLVGQGPLEAQARRQAHDLGLDQQVIFAGYRADVLRIVSEFDVFLLPSRYEGLSIALLEALALGKPVVVTRVGGILEVIRDLKEGLVVPPDTPSAIAEAILLLLQDDGLREQLGRAARQRADDFDIRRAVRHQEEIYERLIYGSPLSILRDQHNNTGREGINEYGI